MAKNITIAEGSQAKNFNTVHKLRTNVIGGGTQYWVPEDEAGAYANLSQKSITANGTYRASDDSKDGYSQVIVNVPPTRPNLTTKNISQNGTYRASDDGADGYSQVTVSGVGEATAILPNPIGGDNNEHYIKPNPTTGIVEDTVLPSSITITTMPTKTVYTNGETIDGTGIVVKAYKNDGTIWESTGYTGGVIPLSELVFDPSTATMGGQSDKKTDGRGLNVIEVEYIMQKCQSWMASEEFTWLPTANAVLGRYGGQPATLGSRGTEAGSKMYLTMYNGSLFGYGIGEDVNAEVRYREIDTGLWHRPYSSTESATYNSWNYLQFASEFGVNWDNVPISSRDPRQSDVEDLHPAGIIYVKWARPKDGKELMASFPITVNPAS